MTPPQGAAVPTELYRVTGVDVEVKYWRGRGLKLQFADPALSDFSGSREANGVTEPGFGIRVDAELLADTNGSITFTLVVPEMTWAGIDGPPLDVDGVVIITRAVKTAEADSYAHQHYEVRHVTGTVTWRVWPEG